jgi:hypothetical protein
VHDVIEHSQADEKTIARVAKSWEKKLPAPPPVQAAPLQEAVAP